MENNKASGFFFETILIKFAVHHLNMFFSKISLGTKHAGVFLGRLLEMWTSNGKTGARWWHEWSIVSGIASRITMILGDREMSTAQVETTEIHNIYTTHYIYYPF